MSEHPSTRKNASTRASAKRKLCFESLEGRRVMATLPLGATAEDTGEFMLGRIAVTPVLLESDGTIDRNTENWTPGHIAAVMDNIQTGLNWWNRLLATKSSVHTLEWVIDRTYVDTRISTPYEPINRRSDDYVLWVDDFLNKVGFDASFDLETNVRSFNEAQRQKLNTDWSFTIFVPNSLNDGAGTFAPGGSFSRAFAFAGGLFQVTPSMRPASTFTHETGHIFWARDEYSGGGTFSDRRGYYNAQNTNAIDGNPNPGFQQLPSIMSAGSSLQTAYDTVVSPDATLAQLGWRDSDNDGIFDVLDVPLKLEGTGRLNPTNLTYQFRGKASAQTLPNINSSGTQNDITLNRVGRIEYRVGTGAWRTIASPNAAVVDLDFTIPITVDQIGATIEIRAMERSLPLASNTFRGTLGDAPDTTSQNGIEGFVWVDTDKNQRWGAEEIGLARSTVTIVDASLKPLALQRVVEPDNFSIGQIGTNQNGVRLDVVGMDATGVLGVFEDPSASTGTKVFQPYSWQLKQFVETFYDRDQQLRGRFDTLQSYVSVDAIAAADGTNVRLDAYDASGNVVARFERKGMLKDQKVTMEVETGTARISYVIARGFQLSSVKFDNFRFGPKNSATTASDGSYSLRNLPPGTYKLLVSPNAVGWEPTNTLDGTLDVALGNQTVVTHVDFGGAFVPSPWQNQNLPADVDASGDVNPLDVLALINDINLNQSRSLVGTPSGVAPFLDVNGDRSVSPLDVLAVINFLNGRNSSNGNGGGLSGEGEYAAPAVIVDSQHGNDRPAFASFANDRPADAPTTWIVDRIGSRLRSQGPEKCGCPVCGSYDSAVANAPSQSADAGNPTGEFLSEPLGPALATSLPQRIAAIDAAFASDA